MIRVTFQNLDQLIDVYDPAIVKKAAESATKRLGDRVATQVSRVVRKRYAISAGEVKAALSRRTRRSAVGHDSLLIYTSGRLSLSRFATGRGKPTRSNRPKVKTRRGVRYGAKVRVVKGRPAKLVPGAFWGRARAGTGPEGVGQGAWQIWKREGLSRDSIRRLTGPGVSQMVRADDAVQSVNQIVDGLGDKILAERLDFYLGRRAGVL